ncbi:MAG: nitroreductase/quinone reductase family protein [Candidatus Limnocylindrales bacterium]
METSEAGGTWAPAEPLSFRERVVLSIHRGLDKRLSRLGVWMVRRSKGSIADRWKVKVLVLTTIGRRTGKRRSVVLQYWPDGDSMILAAANGGEASNPAWYSNLLADPIATAEVRGRVLHVRADTLADDEGARWWRWIAGHAQGYERYERATVRRIPIVRFVRLDDSGS